MRKRSWNISIIIWNWLIKIIICCVIIGCFDWLKLVKIIIICLFFVNIIVSLKVIHIFSIVGVIGSIVIIILLWVCFKGYCLLPWLSIDWLLPWLSIYRLFPILIARILLPDLITNGCLCIIVMIGYWLLVIAIKIWIIHILLVSYAGCIFNIVWNKRCSVSNVILNYFCVSLWRFIY